MVLAPLVDERHLAVAVLPPDVEPPLSRQHHHDLPVRADPDAPLVPRRSGRRGRLARSRRFARGRFDRLIGVPVPKGRLEAGRRLAAVDFETRWLTANRLRSEWVRSRDTLDGQEALRALIAGQPVARDAIGAHRLVRRGERVTLVFATDGLHLEASGTARGDAGMDEAVEVENDRSGTIVTGRVRAAGRVHVETRR
ncbi:MAG: flagellar basal body P-ring formation chaperone FlgA [Spirochaetota bacterium]